MARTRVTRVREAKLPETPCSPTPGDPRFSRETPEKLLQEILAASPSDYIRQLAMATLPVYKVPLSFDERRLSLPVRLK